MAREALRRDIKLTIEAILTQGNYVNQRDRDICRRVFGATLIEHYSTKEGGQLAHPCELHKLHLNSEGSFLEVLDKDGNQCRPGETGRVVITPIFQTAQPLIRYEQGDLATVGSPCACGRHSPTLDAVIGRSVSMFSHPSGRAKVVAVLPYDTPERLQSVCLQVAQVGPNDYEVRYQPIDWSRFGDEQAVADSLRTLLWDDIDVRFVRTRSLAMSLPDKLIELVNEFDPTMAN
jgi:phenylacetate-CoA ligase